MAEIYDYNASSNPGDRSYDQAETEADWERIARETETDWTPTVIHENPRPYRFSNGHDGFDG